MATMQYTYNSQPRSAPRPGANEQNVTLTLMSDPRVVRGNTHSLARKYAKDRTERISEHEIPGRAFSSSQKRESSSMPTYQFSARPFALDGTDLSQHLVDQSEKEAVPSRICETQTDELTSLPPPQAYVPLKTGVDQYTQVVDVDELFNFDEESAPVVEVIIQKTLEQALVEVNHEEELIALQKQMEEFEYQRVQEIEWMKQQEDSVVQDYMQVRGVVDKMQSQLKRTREVKGVIAGLQMARQIIPASLDSIMASWQSPEEQGARLHILPQLISSASKNSNVFHESSIIVDELLNGAVDRFDSIPTFKKPSNSNLRKLSIRLMRVQQEEFSREVVDDSEVPPTETREISTVAAVLSVPIESLDSIQSLESKLRNLLSTLRSPPNNSEPTDEEAAPPSTVNDWYPSFISLYASISEVIMSSYYDTRGYPRIPIAKDAQLSFFPLELETIVVDHILA